MFQHLAPLFALSMSLLCLACPTQTNTEAKTESKTESKTDSKAPGPAVEAPVGETPTFDRGGDRLSLGAAKIMREGHEDRAIELRADGSVTLAGTPFGTIAVDGSLHDAAGELMMSVEADGSVISPAGPTGLTVTETGGSIALPKLSVEVSFSADGKIETQASGQNAVLLGPDSPQLRSSGCEGPVTKSCALITLAYLSALGNPDSVREESPTPE